MVGVSPYPTKALTQRTSAQVYNTLDDYEQLAQAVLEFLAGSSGSKPGCQTVVVGGEPPRGSRRFGVRLCNGTFS